MKASSRRKKLHVSERRKSRRVLNHSHRLLAEDLHRLVSRFSTSSSLEEKEAHPLPRKRFTGVASTIQSLLNRVEQQLSVSPSREHSSFRSQQETRELRRETDLYYLLQAQRALGEGVVIFDIAARKLLYANEAYYDLTQYAERDLLGKNVFTSLADLKRIFPPTLAKSYLIEPLSHHAEVSILRKDRTIIPAEISLRRMGTKQSSVFLGIVRDVSERKRAEIKLQKWAHIFENISLGVMVTDALGTTIELVNPAFARMHRHESPKEVIGKDPKRFFAPEFRSDFSQMLLRGKGRLKQTLEALQLRKDDSLFPSLLDMTLVKQKGQVAYRVFTVRDISLRKKLESKLVDYTRGLERRVEKRTSELQKKLLEEEQEKAKDEALLQSLGEGVIAIDERKRIMFVNNQAERLLRIKAISVLNRKLFEVISLRRIDSAPFLLHDRPVELAISLGKKVMTRDFEYVRSDGTSFPASITASPVFLHGQFIGAVTIFHDITKEEEIMKAKTEFVSLASHQLRTPLSMINWYTETLLSGKLGSLDSLQKKYLEEIYHASQRMVQLVNMLLNIARLERSTYSLEAKPTNLPDIVKSVLDEMKFHIRKKNLNVHESYDRSLPLVELDRDMMRIVLHNLLSNAVKYTPRGGKITVKVRLFDESQSTATRMSDVAEKSVLIRVTDTGVGIPPEVRDKIFTKFFRADNIKILDQDGTGLGLYMVKSIIELSKGTIWFTSELRKGTTFFVKIPLNVATL